jgi:hypothetical protein
LTAVKKVIKKREIVTDEDGNMRWVKPKEREMWGVE